MKKIRLLNLWILLSGGLLLASCTKNDSSTIILVGDESYIEDIVKIIPESAQEDFFAAFGNINPETGPVPPKIEGSYVMGPKQRVASNMPDWPLDQVEGNMYLRFTIQHNGIAKIELKEITNAFTTYPVFVCGNGNDNSFTVYFEEKINEEANGVSIKMTRAVVMKGKVTNEGLADFRYANIIKESDNDQLAAPGSFFIYKDGNGLAERYDW